MKMFKQFFTELLNKNYVKDEDGFKHIDREKYRQFNQIRPDGLQKHFCYVPFNSLTFSFKGKVFACTYNRDVLLGTYPENTINEIWNGKNAQLLREYMRHNDLSFGCQHCKYFFDKGKFSNLKPLVFDKYSDIQNIHFPQVMEFEMSNVCNYECQMCSGEVSSLIRKNRDNLPPIEVPYDSEFVKQLEPYIPYLKEAKFFGGEPFLIDIYHDIWDKMLEINPDIKFFVITNGSVWNNRVKGILEKGQFDIAISIDSLQKEKLERIRKHSKYERVMENISHFNEYAKKNGRAISLSFTLQKDNWDEFADMIRFCNEIDAYIFVSYLEWPEQFSIADLSLEEIKAIRDFIGKETFTGISGCKKHNAKCYEDFKTYLDNFIEKKNISRYLEYRVGNEKTSNPDDIKLLEYKDHSLLELKELLFQNVEEYFNKNITSNESKAIFYQKFNHIIDSFEDDGKIWILKFMLISHTNIWVIDILNEQDSVLIENAKRLVSNRLKK